MLRTTAVPEAVTVLDRAGALQATVTDAGTVRVALVLARVTVAPPVGAGCVRVTVQVLEEFDPRLAGLQANDDTSTDATRLTLAVAELLL